MSVHVHKLTESHCCWNHDLWHALKEGRITQTQYNEELYDLEEKKDNGSR